MNIEYVPSTVTLTLPETFAGVGLAGKRVVFNDDIRHYVEVFAYKHTFKREYIYDLLLPIIELVRNCNNDDTIFTIVFWVRNPKAEFFLGCEAIDLEKEDENGERGTDSFDTATLSNDRIRQLIAECIRQSPGNNEFILEIQFNNSEVLGMLNE